MEAVWSPRTTRDSVEACLPLNVLGLSTAGAQAAEKPRASFRAAGGGMTARSSIAPCWQAPIVQSDRKQQALGAQGSEAWDARNRAQGLASVPSSLLLQLTDRGQLRPSGKVAAEGLAAARQLQGMLRRERAGGSGSGGGGGVGVDVSDAEWALLEAVLLRQPGGSQTGSMRASAAGPGRGPVLDSASLRSMGSSASAVPYYEASFSAGGGGGGSTRKVPFDELLSGCGGSSRCLLSPFAGDSSAYALGSGGCGGGDDDESGGEGSEGGDASSSCETEGGSVSEPGHEPPGGVPWRVTDYTTGRMIIGAGGDAEAVALTVAAANEAASALAASTGAADQARQGACGSGGRRLASPVPALVLTGIVGAGGGGGGVHGADGHRGGAGGGAGGAGLLIGYSLSPRGARPAHASGRGGHKDG
jgi:hypothetical protein